MKITEDMPAARQETKEKVGAELAQTEEVLNASRRLLHENEQVYRTLAEGETQGE